MKWTLWAAVSGLFVELAWWLLNKDRNAWVQSRPSQAYYNRDEYWGDL